MDLSGIDKDYIEEFADSGSILARGKDYFDSGRVGALTFDGDSLTAEVEGSHDYNVRIWTEKGDVSAECGCPYDGYGCKHIVAVMYKWIGEKGKTKNKPSGNLNLKKELSGMDRDSLLTVLTGLCEDPQTRKEVMLKIAAEKGMRGYSARIAAQQIKDALRVRGGFIDYYEMPGVMAKLRKVRKSMLRLAPDARTPALERLCSAAGKASMECDDSSGMMSEFVFECLGYLGSSMREQNLSFKEKKSIIKKNLDVLERNEDSMEDGYFDLVMALPSDEKDFSFLEQELKKRIKGKEDSYRKDLLQEMLVQVYARTGRDDDRLKMLEQRAREEGDYEPLVNFWTEKGEPEKAVEAAEKEIKNAVEEGLEPFRWNSNLLGFLETAYEKKKDPENLLRVLNLQFTMSPSISAYKKILKVSGPVRAEETKKRLILEAEREALVEILLFEGMFEGACEKLADPETKYSDRFRDKVARTVVKEFPEKSLEIYVGIVADCIGMGNRDGYRTAAFYAGKVKELYSGMNLKGWDSYIEGIREKNKRKPALQQEFAGL